MTRSDLCLLLALAAIPASCQKMRQPAHGTVRARSVEVVLDGLRPVVVADLRVEVLGALPGASYDVGPVLAARSGSGDGSPSETAWRCVGDGCSVPVETTSELYPLDVRYALDQAAEEEGVERPGRLRFELRERTPDGRTRVMEATEPIRLEEACLRLGRVPLEMRRIARERVGPEGEITANVVRATAGCEGPVLHVEMDHRVMPLAGTRPVVRVAVGLPGSGVAACEGPDCEADLEPPDRGSSVIEKHLGRSFAALGKPATRSEVHLFLERRPLASPSGDGGGGSPAGAVPTGFLDHHVYELVSPGSGVVM